MTDGELENLNKLLRQIGNDNLAGRIAEVVLHLIKQNTPSKESVVPLSNRTSRKADDSSIPDDDSLEDIYYRCDVSNNRTDNPMSLEEFKAAIHQQRLRWESAARQTAVNEAMDWISKNNSKFQKHLDKIALRELAATLASAEEKEEV